MDISIIICTSNRAAALRETLKMLARIEVPRGEKCECVIVDNASTDDTARVVEEAVLPFNKVYVHEPRRGKGNAYNTGMATARSDIFLFTDDDVHPPAHWIGAITQPLKNGSAEGVTGGVVMAPHLQKPWMEKEQRSVIGATTDLLDVTAPNQMIGANMAFSRRVLARVPAFDPELGPGALGFGDETLFSWQMLEAGFRLAPALEVQVEHHFDASRLKKSQMHATAQRLGRSLAYMAYHWMHQEKIAADEKVDIARRIWRPLYWTYRRINDRLHRHPFPIWELHEVRDAAFREQYEIERQRPRNYEKRGLVKLNHR